MSPQWPNNPNIPDGPSEPELEYAIKGTTAELTRLKGLVREMGKLKCDCPGRTITNASTSGEEVRIIGYEIHHRENCILIHPDFRAILDEK